MTEQFQLRLSMPGSFMTIRTSDLGAQRRLVLGTTDECDRKLFCPGVFAVALEREHDRWALTPADDGTKIYVCSGRDQYEESARFELTDGAMVSVCAVHEGEVAEVMQVQADADHSDQVNTKYDLRIMISDRNMVTIGSGDCMISFDKSLVLGNTVTVNRNGSRWTVEQNRDGTALLNMTPISGVLPLYEHDFITLGGVRLYFADGSLYTASELKPGVRGLHESQVTESAGALEYPIFIRSTRIQHQIADNKIEIQQPARANKPNEDNMLLRILPSAAMLLAMLLMRAGQGGNGLTMALYMGASMGSSILVTILTKKESKKKAQEEAINRRNRYLEYIQNKIDEITVLRQDEMRVLERIYRSEDDNINIIRNFDKGLFDRSPQDKDFLDIRLGRGKREAAITVSTNTPEYRETDDDLVDTAEQVIEKYKYLEKAPVVARLGHYNALGVVGRRKWLYEMVKTMTLDLIVRQYYRDLKIYYVIGEDDADQFAWVRWLQNCAVGDESSMRTILCDDESNKLYLEVLYRILSSRASESEGKEILWPEYHVVFVYRIDVIRNHPISQFFEHCAHLGVRFIFMDEAEERIPRGCGQMIRLDNAGNTGTLFYSHAAEQDTTFEYMTMMDERMEETVRKLAPVRVVESSLANEMSKSITLYELLGIHSPEDLDLARLWSQSNIVKSMSVPLGVKTKNAIQYLDIHEKAHGPHGLVAGTTGSGKSEILQSYLINLAVYFPPDEVNYLLIDFKGGGMSNLFEGLPHLTGAITDIDGREIERSLKAIRAELERRKRMFEKVRVNKIDDYIKMRKKDPGSVPVALPHLIIVVDEFAELKAEQPDFMKELISTARVGRSLGVHLILATQKPTGVVDPQIVSNSRFRLCLKVASKEDSNEMIKTPLAAEIREPGRAYLQVGNNEIFELFQSAYSGGAEPSADSQSVKPFKINELNLWGKPTPVYQIEAPKDKSGEAIRARSELEAIRDYIIRFCKDVGIETLQQVCLPPMPSLIALDTLPVPERGEPGTIIVNAAMYDDPEEHYQGPYAMDLAQNNTFIIGASQMGKTEALISIIHQAVMTYEADEVNFYIIDAGNLAMSVFEGCAHVGDIVDYRNEDLVENTMKFLRQTVDSRREKMMSEGIGTYLGYCAMGKKDMPLIVLVIDNIAAFREYYDKYDEALQALAREGMSAGVTMILTGVALNNIHYRMQTSFTMKMCLTVNDPTEYLSITNVRNFEPHNTPGCCLVPLEKRTVEAQFGLPIHLEMDEEFAAENRTEEDRQRLCQYMAKDDKRRTDALRKALEQRNELTRGKAPRIPVVPATLLLEDEMVRNPAAFRTPYTFVIGMEYSTIDYVSVNLTKTSALLVSGMSTADLSVPIRTIMRQIEKNIIVHQTETWIFDSSKRALSDLRDYSFVKDYTTDISRMKEIVEELDEITEKRQKVLYDLEDETGREDIVSKWPLLQLVIYDDRLIQEISGNQDISSKLLEMIERRGDCRISVIFGRYPNARPGYNDDLGKYLTTEAAAIYCDKISNAKYLDITGSLKKLTRAFSPNDAYYSSTGEISHIKLMTT